MHHHTFLGGQPVIPANNETLLVNRCDTLADWNWPIGGFELRLMVKELLDMQGILKT